MCIESSYCEEGCRTRLFSTIWKCFKRFRFRPAKIGLRAIKTCDCWVCFDPYNGSMAARIRQFFERFWILRPLRIGAIIPSFDSPQCSGLNNVVLHEEGWDKDFPLCDTLWLSLLSDSWRFFVPSQGCFLPIRKFCLKFVARKVIVIKSTSDSLYMIFHRFTVHLWRPRARRLFRSSRQIAVSIRSRIPCTRQASRLFGW